MKRKIYFVLWGMIFFMHSTMVGQSIENCFLNDFELKRAKIPTAVSAKKPTDPVSIVVTVQGDTLGKISKYVFGNAIAAWAGSGYTNTTLVNNTKLLAPTLIRFPGGSWSDIYYWNGLPSDIPDSLYDGQTYNGSTAKKAYVFWESGKGSWVTTPFQYNAFINQLNTQGLITVNYAYARYGLSPHPVAQAAHQAAEWVRYDQGRTLFWEIGNENAGPWEAGWMIDTKTNKDGQPQIISGELYGRHFKVFVDSMKSAAAEAGATIYIGGQVLHYDGTTSWNFVDKNWNEGFFREVGDSADFYVMHNYFSSSDDAKSILDFAVTEPKKNIDFIRQDILNKNAHPKPVALTEYNIGTGTAARGTSYINGMQAVILASEMIKNNFGLAARWLLVTGDGGMFYDGSDANYSYHPHPDFYYLRFLQKFYGDHAISAVSPNADILCYASKYSSGEIGVILVNTSSTKQVIRLDTKKLGVGKQYYIYSFTGGTDNGDFSQNVFINGNGPNTYQWGPFNTLSDIPADSYPIESEIKFTSPARSVQMIMIEGGTNIASVNNEVNFEMPRSFHVSQNYPNPFNPTTIISYEIPVTGNVRLSVFDVLGREVTTLVNERQNAGTHSVLLNASNLPSGIYFYRLESGNNHETRKLLLIK